MSPASFACLGLLLSAVLYVCDARGAGLRAQRIAVADTPRIDGILSDPAWRRAPVYDDFHKHQPRDGVSAPGALKTSVQLLVDDGALVFGIRAWDDAPQLRRGLLARRDKVAVDQDFIGIWIDPAGHGRNAQFVRINTAGVVSDGMHRAEDDESDLGPDFPVETAVTILPDGYSMEVRWPLSNLRFPYADGRNWRVMVERSIPHADGMLLVSAPFRIDALSHLSFLQEIEGMDATVEAVRDRRFLELRPELTVRSERAAMPGARTRGSQADWAWKSMPARAPTGSSTRPSIPITRRSRSTSRCRRVRAISRSRYPRSAASSWRARTCSACRCRPFIHAR